METLYIRNGDQTKSYRISTSYNTTPYLKVDTGYLNLTTETRTGMQLKVKIGTQTYRPYVTVTTTSSRSSECETPAYSGVSSSKSTNTSQIISGKRLQSLTSTSTNTTFPTSKSVYSLISSETMYLYSSTYTYRTSQWANYSKNSKNSIFMTFMNMGSSTNSSFGSSSESITNTFQFSASINNLATRINSINTRTLTIPFYYNTGGKGVAGTMSLGSLSYATITLQNTSVSSLLTYISAVSASLTSKYTKKVSMASYRYSTTLSSNSMSTTNVNSTQYSITSDYISTGYSSGTVSVTYYSSSTNSSNLSSVTDIITTSSRSSQYNTITEED